MDTKQFLDDLSQSMNGLEEHNMAFERSNSNLSVPKSPTDTQKTVISFVLDETTSENKKQKTSATMAPVLLLSTVYAIILVLVGVCFPVSEALRDSWLTEHVVGGFLVYLFVLSSAFLIYLQVEHYLSQRRSKKNLQTLSDEQQVRSENAAGFYVRRGSAANVLDGDFHAQIRDGCRSKFNYDDTTHSESLDDEEIFEYIALRQQTASLGEHGAGIYLRLGCLLFAVGNLVYVIIEINHYENGRAPADCIDRPILWPMYFHLCFILVQTFSVFKGISIHGCKHKVTSIGLMHVLATNLCVWFRFLVKEIAEGVHVTSHANSDDVDDNNSGGIDVEGYAVSDNTSISCVEEGSLLYEASHYLFPFILEYSLIAVATMAGLLSSLHMTVTVDMFKKVKAMLLRRQKGQGQTVLTYDNNSEQNGTANPHDHNSLLQKSHKGIFGGILLLTGMILIIVLFYVNNGDDLFTGSLIYHSANMILTTLLLVALPCGFIFLRHLGRNFARINLIDDLLLLFSMAGFVLLQLFRMISGFYFLLGTYESTSVYLDSESLRTLSILEITASMLETIQCVTQTIFVIDGLQRFARDQKQATDKSGRGIVGFLIVANLCMWIFTSLLIKEVILSRHLDFYGSTAWPIIFSICVPLQLFFYFHSSVCLADVWIEAYKSKDEPLLETKNFME